MTDQQVDDKPPLWAMLLVFVGMGMVIGSVAFTFGTVAKAFYEWMQP